MYQITLTILGTVISGVLVFVLCQIIVQKYIKTYEEYKTLKGKVAFLLVMYANLYCNPINVLNVEDEDKIEKRKQAGIETRILAAELSAFQERVEKGGVGIPSKDKLIRAASELIFLSNSFFVHPDESITTASKNNRECADKIKEALSISVDVKRL